MNQNSKKIVHPLNIHPLIKAYIEGNAFGRLLNIDFEIEAPGKVAYKAIIGEQHLATIRAAHGGLIATLCDGALGIAALSLVVERDHIVATVEMQVRYLKPVLLGDHITAIGEVIQAGKRLLVSEVKVYNQRKELIAMGSGTFNAYPAIKAGY